MSVSRDHDQTAGVALEGEMIERVAAAILKAEGDERGIPVEWSDITDELRHSLRLQARAAIEAMREPTEAQWAAGTTQLRMTLRSPGSVWQAMIQAALTTKEPR